MKGRVAILLNGPVKNDYRVIKTINTLLKSAEIDLFYINGNETADQKLFEEWVDLHALEHPINFKTKLLRHSFFCREFMHFHKAIEKSGKQFDAIWANDLPTLLPAYKSAKKQNARLIYDSHEIYLETLNQFFPRKAKFPKTIVFKLLLSLMKLHGSIVERQLFRQVDHFITVNHSLLAFFKAKYTVRQATVIYNYPKRLSGEVVPVDYRKLFNWEESDIILIYQGVLNEGRGLHLLLKTLHHIPEKFKLIIVGDGPIRDQLETYTSRHNFGERIKFMGMVPLGKLPSYTMGADIGVNLLEELNLSKKLASPNKLFEYIQAGIPVIASQTVENELVLKNQLDGVLVQNNMQSFKEALSFLLDNSQISAKTSNHNSPESREQYIWEIQESKLISLLA